MDKFKLFTFLLSGVSLILLIIVIFGGKETIYVCYDGTEKEAKDDCPSMPPLAITEKEAKAAMTDYATSFARSKPGVIASVIGEVSRINNSWQSYVTFANSRTGEFNQLTFNIDGKTSSITCLTGCDYLNINVNASNASQTPENVIVVQ